MPRTLREHASFADRQHVQVLEEEKKELEWQLEVLTQHHDAMSSEVSWMRVSIRVTDTPNRTQHSKNDSTI